MDKPAVAQPDAHLALFHRWLGDLTAGADAEGFEIVRMLRAVGNQVTQQAASLSEGASMSGPRWHLLLRLLLEERRGDSEGVAPSYLSRCQDVSKNTISVLLRGLEEDGWVERTLDPEDRRGFRIRLTPAGRQLILETAPGQLARLNALIEELNPVERAELLRLLSKLHHSLAARAAIRSAAVDVQP